MESPRRNVRFTKPQRFGFYFNPFLFFAKIVFRVFPPEMLIAQTSWFLAQTLYFSLLK